MPISWIAGAALALFMTGVAFAQTTTAPAEGGALPPPPELAPAAPAEGENAAPAEPSAEAVPEAGAADAMRELERARARSERRDRRRAMRDRRRDMDEEDGEHHGWRDHHRAMGHVMDRRGRAGPRGAVFRFSRGEDGPSIVIRCADRDTTQECVDAIGPMMQMMLPNAQ